MCSSSVNGIANFWRPSKSCLFRLHFNVLADFVSTQKRSWVPLPSSCPPLFTQSNVLFDQQSQFHLSLLRITWSGFCFTHQHGENHRPAEKHCQHQESVYSGACGPRSVSASSTVTAHQNGKLPMLLKPRLCLLLQSIPHGFEYRVSEGISFLI